MRSNPVFRKAVEERSGFGEQANVMTINGAATKTFMLLCILAVSFTYTWMNAYNVVIGAKTGTGFPASIAVAAIAAMIIAFVTSFVPRISPITAPLYAVAEGVLLGSLSRFINVIYPDVVLPAMVITFALAISALLVYRARPTMADRMRKGVIIAMMGLLLTYLASFILGFFGITLPIFGSGPIGILFSLFVIGLGTASLILDYDMTVKMSYMAAPKYMEWYCGFGILVTLVWIYVEVLDLLLKLKDD